jgi:hypothetical protein
MRQSVQREGEIYLSMAKEIYYEPGRTVETMSPDGDDGEATLHEPYTDAKGGFRIRNDFTSGRYKVISDVTEATATRREKTVRSMLSVAEVSVQAQDMEGAQAALITATLNMDGEGLDDYQRWNRQRALKLGLVQPNEEEKQELAQLQAQAAQQPNPEQQIADAKVQELRASAIQKGADAGLKIAQAHALGGPAEVPETPDGLEQAHTLAQIGKTAAETEHLRTQTAHLPQQLAIEALNAKSNAVKAHASTLNKQKPKA